MKRSDFKRILSLYINSDVAPKTCVQIIIQLSKDQYEATEYIFEFLKEIGLIIGEWKRSNLKK